MNKMERRSTLVLGFSLLLHLLVVSAVKKTYIVYLGSHAYGNEASLDDYQLATQSHYELLGSFVGREKAQDAIIYSYARNINGFAANLEKEEADKIANHPDVISVFESKMYKVQTTRSWSFVGLETNSGHVHPHSLWRKAKFGKDVIIATLDTGVWPESKSFRDEGMGPVPARWKGYCDNTNTNTTYPVPACNRKLIGARFFNKGMLVEYPGVVTSNSSRDMDGHGTHTLSTAGGQRVHGANMFGYANGTAVGGAPHARVASYKVCWDEIASEADILAGFEAAIHDGADVISVSLAVVTFPLFDKTSYFDDAIKLGSLHAVKHGVTVSCAAGNAGGFDLMVENTAPWIITVGASTLDRELLAYITLGNKKIIKGISLESSSLPPEKFYPLINASDAALPSSAREDAALCKLQSLDPSKVKGKIVVCLLANGSAPYNIATTVHDIGAAGTIAVNDQSDTYSHIYYDRAPEMFDTPATTIPYGARQALYSYMHSTKNPLATISPPVTKLGVKPAPSVAFFSLHGPSGDTTSILKPDIMAPGENILAAYSEGVSPTGLGTDHRVTPYVILFGTSMACPHVSGIAGLLKALHPDWSPAAIRSAIMTTAGTKDNTGTPIKNAEGESATPFEYGAGHIRPNLAAQPGLVYDATFEDYLSILCTLGFTSTELTKISGAQFTCPSVPAKLEDLNYPSITIPYLNATWTVTRTLKNVGPPGVYTAKVDAPSGVAVSIKPNIVKFVKFGEEKVYRLTFEPINGQPVNGSVFGSLSWSDGKHHVTSPLVVGAAVD